MREDKRQAGARGSPSSDSYGRGKSAPDDGRSRSALLLQELEEQIAREEEDGEVLREICFHLSRIANSLEKMARRDGNELKPTYTVSEAANILGRSPSTVRRWIREGKLESSKSADNQQGQHLIPRHSIQEYL